MCVFGLAFKEKCEKLHSHTHTHTHTHVWLVITALMSADMTDERRVEPYIIHNISFLL